MKNRKLIVKKIMEYCPFSWAQNEEEVESHVDYLFSNNDQSFDFTGEECGGFKYLKTKKGRRYMETIPARIYID